MGIFISHLLGKLRNSVGNLTMYKLEGQNIVRGKTFHRSNVFTPKQVLQQFRMRAIQRLAPNLGDVIVMGFPGRSYRNSLNGFVNKNINLINPDENGQASFDPRLLQLSSGQLDQPAVTAVINQANQTVTFGQKQQPLRPLSPDDDQVYGIIWAPNGEEIMICRLKQRGESATILIALAKEIQHMPLEVYAFTVSANGQKTSRTIWLTGESE